MEQVYCFPMDLYKSESFLGVIKSPSLALRRVFSNPEASKKVTSLFFPLLACTPSDSNWHAVARAGPAAPQDLA